MDNPYNVGDKELLSGVYCEEVIKNKDKLLVPDSSKDEKWRDNPDARLLDMVSYLGFPIKWPDDNVFGTICILDSEENAYSEKLERVIKHFADLINSHLRIIYQQEKLKEQNDEIKEVRDRLEANNTKLSLLINRAPLGIFKTTSTGKVLSINPAMVKILGCDNRKEVYSRYKNLASDLYVFSEDRQEFVRVLQQKGEINNYEYRARKYDGSEIWLLMNARISKKNDDGSFIIEGFTSDITEQKIAAERLKKSQALLKESQKIAHIGSWELDLVTGVLIWSEETYQIFGVKANDTELNYDSFLEMIHPDDRDRVNRAYNNSINDDNDTYEIEHRIIRPTNHEIRYVHEKCLHIKDNSGSIIRSIGMVQDITESKEKEERIKQLAYHDSLTGAYNRTYLEKEIDRVEKEKQFPLSIIVADVSELKKINDTYGHLVGDKVLRDTVDILENSVRKGDTLVRWGGDEFVILLPMTDKSEAMKVFNRISEKCSQTQREVPLSLDMGLAVKKYENENIYDIFKKADKLMYKNKNRKKGEV